MNRLLYRIEEAADTLGMSRASVYREIAAGRLVAVNTRGGRRVSANALAVYITQLEKEERKAKETTRRLVLSV